MLRSVARRAPKAVGIRAAVAPTVTQRRHLNVNAVVNKWTAKSFVDTWRKLESELGMLRVTAKSLPDVVPPIDWAFYKAKIKTPGVVDKIKAEYETKKFEVPTPSFDETDRNIGKMEKWYTVLKEHSQKKITMLEAKVEELNEEKSTVGFWSTSDVFFKFPGLQEQLALRSGRARLKNRYTPHTRIVVFDFSEARKALKEGRKPEGLPPPLRAVGDFNRDEWDKREQRELAWLESEFLRITGDDSAAASSSTNAVATAAPAPAPGVVSAAPGAASAAAAGGSAAPAGGSAALSAPAPATPDVSKAPADAKH